MNKIKEGFFYTSLAQFANVVSLLLINIILSHKLAPSDFGVVTIVQIVATFMNLFTSEAVPSAIIQDKRLKDRDYGVLFNYSVAFGIIVTIFFGFFGFVLSYFFNDNIYVPVSWLMSILVFASFANCVPQGLFLKGLNFKALSVRRIISSLLGLASGIIAIMLSMGIYAIVITLVIPVVFTLIFNLFYVNIPYNFSFNRKPIKLVGRYVIEQSKFSVLNYGYRNIDNILIGRFFGATDLGYYSKSYQLLSQPITLFLGIITPVLQPVLSNFEDDIHYLQNFYIKISREIAFIAIPISVFFSINSKEIIYFLFGKQWTGAILPMAVLSLSIWVQLLAQVITPIWQSLNLPRLQTRNGEISFILITSFIFIGIVSHSIIYVAFAVSFSYYVNFFVSAGMLMRKGLHSNLFKLSKVLVMPLISGGVSTILMILAKMMIEFNSIFLTLIVRGIIWIIGAVMFLYLTGNLKDIYAFLKK